MHFALFPAQNAIQTQHKNTQCSTSNVEQFFEKKQQQKFLSQFQFRLKKRTGFLHAKNRIM